MMEQKYLIMKNEKDAGYIMYIIYCVFLCVHYNIIQGGCIVWVFSKYIFSFLNFLFLLENA